MSRPRPRWHQNAVIYAIDVEAFRDADGDGVGDFKGLTARLDYLADLGVDCVWLLPFYPTPNRDNGYDVADYYGVDPRHGTLGDVVDFVRAANEHGIRVLIDLVVNHTSNEHPWFQKAREGQEPYRDYYVWSEDPPAFDPARGSVFPGEVEEDRVWTWDEEAGAYYYHRFYPFQPDLNLANPDVREEIRKIVEFWLRLGVAGFRVDAAGLMVEEKRPGIEAAEVDHSILEDLRSFATRYRDDVVLMAEADVDLEDLPTFAGAERMDLLLNFVLNARLFLALATERGAPLEELFAELPALPADSQWANFLRNYDELNVGSLPPEAKRAVFDRFAPDESTRIYGRGIRRRLAPMLDGDRRRIELAFSLLVSMPGSTLLVYGDEIGMGEDLSLPGRTAVRTPMQWLDDRNAGFSTADREDLVRPVVDSGPFAYELVNVADQRADDDSLLAFVKRLFETRHETPAIGAGEMSVIETDLDGVFVHRFDHDGSTVVVAHTLAEEDVTVTVDVGDVAEPVQDLLGSGSIRTPGDGSCELELDGYGHRWIRFERDGDSG